MGMAERNEATENGGEGEAANKPKSNAGAPERPILSIMRSRAYIYELIRRRGVPTPNALAKVMYPKIDYGKPESRGTDTVPDLSKHLRGERAVSEQMLNMASQIPVQATARRVFEIGPEEGGNNVPLWSIFEDRFSEFEDIIESGLRQSRQGVDTGLKRADRVALLFLPADQWHQLQTNSDVAAGLNLAQQAHGAGYFKADVRRLAAMLACWRLCLQGPEEWGPTETLLDWLITGPYAQVLANLGISVEMRDLLRAIAEDHHLGRGNVAAAARALTRFGGGDKRIDPFG